MGVRPLPVHRHHRGRGPVEALVRDAGTARKLSQKDHVWRGGLIRECLEKDPTKRLPDYSSLDLALAEAAKKRGIRYRNSSPEFDMRCRWLAQGHTVTTFGRRRHTEHSGNLPRRRTIRDRTVYPGSAGANVCRRLQAKRRRSTAACSFPRWSRLSQTTLIASTSRSTTRFV